MKVYKRENRTFVVTSPTIKQDLCSLSMIDLRQIRCIRFVVGPQYAGKNFLQANKIICFNRPVKIVFVFAFEKEARCLWDGDEGFNGKLGRAKLVFDGSE
jgi:hypothetical protein